MTRYLVLGDPVVCLGAQAMIGDGGLVVQDAAIVAAGPREEMAALGPFDRVLGSPGHFVLPGFVNCHYHSELAIGPGLYQYIFEKANVHIQAATGDIAEEDLYLGILWGLITAIKGGQTATVNMYYGRPSLPDFGCGRPCAPTRTPGCGPPSGWSAATRTFTRTSRTRSSSPGCRPTWPSRCGTRRWDTPGRLTR